MADRVKVEAVHGTSGCAATLKLPRNCRSSSSFSRSTQPFPEYDQRAAVGAARCIRVAAFVCRVTFTRMPTGRDFSLLPGIAFSPLR